MDKTRELLEALKAHLETMGDNDLNEEEKIFLSLLAVRIDAQLATLKDIEARRQPPDRLPPLENPHSGEAIPRPL